MHSAGAVCRLVDLRRLLNQHQHLEGGEEKVSKFRVVVGAVNVICGTFVLRFLRFEDGRKPLFLLTECGLNDLTSSSFFSR